MGGTQSQLHEQVAACQAELERLAERQRELEQQLADSARLVAELDARLAEREHTVKACMERCARAEQQASRLMRLYVVLHRLHEARGRQQVLDAIQEIVNHVIGSEELGLFRVDERTGALALVASMGIPPERYSAMVPGQGPIGQVVQSGQAWFAPRPPHAGQGEPAGVSACVPLRLEGRVHGALAIFGLLPHKQELDEVDYELLGLLEEHAARALLLADMLSGQVRLERGG